MSGGGKTAVLQLATVDTDRYSSFTLCHNYNYCLRHGYEHVVVKDRLSDRWPGWDKVRILMKYLDEFDTLFVLDADAIFMDFQRTIRSFVGRGQKELVICQDDGDTRDYRVNTGAVLLRPKDRTYWQGILKKWWEIGETLELTHRFFFDQTALVTLLMSDFRAIQSRTRVARSDEFNGRNWYDPKYPRRDPKPILHWMGADTEERCDVLGEACEASRMWFPNGMRPKL